MFKKINILTNVAAVGIIILSILYGNNIKDGAAFPLMGVTAIAWFVAVFCSHRKTVKKRRLISRNNI
ncbi:MAG: hypothetical protein WC788_00795 [Candidatus Paceibacterota bacterium]